MMLETLQSAYLSIGIVIAVIALLGGLGACYEYSLNIYGVIMSLVLAILFGTLWPVVLVVAILSIIVYIAYCTRNDD
jgi:hypothetical protein